MTLVRANHVFLLEPSIDPAIEQQAISRVHRIGQQRPVHIMRLMISSSIEEEVVKLQRRRQELFAEHDGKGAEGHPDDDGLSDGDAEAATTVAGTYVSETLDQDELDMLFDAVLG